jgi:ferredoxin
VFDSRPGENSERLKKSALDFGFSFAAVADISSVRGEFLLPESLRDRFPWALALGKRLVDDVLDDIDDHPTPLYFNHYRQLNFFLDRGAFFLASQIQESGFHALPIPASQIIDGVSQRAHVPHKKIAVLAGIGFIGRNNLLVHPEYGSRLRLVTVLTDLPLDADSPLETDCGSCIACLASCPAQAIKIHREDFDHRRCFEKLEEFRHRRYVSQHICGVCVKACRGPAVRL